MRNRVTSEPFLAMLVLALVVAAAFSLYVATIAPGITWSNLGADGGDLLTAAFTWGIPHPTGYPTYLLALRGFAALVPVGEPAFRGNLMSAVFAALATGLVFVAAHRVALVLPYHRAAAGSSPGAARSPLWVPIAAAAVAALGAGAARQLWSQATITEVYALNAFFVALTLAGCAAVLVRKTDSSSSPAWLSAGLGFAMGVGLGNHVTLALAAGPVLGAVAWRYHRNGPGRDARVPIAMAVAFLAGLAVYVYAPIASSQHPPVNWGHPDTPQGFWWMISGSIYQDYAFGAEPERFLARTATWADFLISQYSVIGLWIGLAGLYALWRHARLFAVSTATGVVLVSLYAIGYDTPDSFLYLIPAFLIFAVWIAAGIAWALIEIHRYFGRYAGAEHRSGRRTRLAAWAFLAAATVAIPGFSIYANAGSLNLRGQHAAADFASSALETAGPDAVILAADSERVFSLWYQRYVAEPGRGPAVVSLPHLQFDWYWNDLFRQFPDRIPATPPKGFDQRVDAVVGHNLGLRPVFAASSTRLLDRYRLAEEGAIYRIDGPR